MSTATLEAPAHAGQTITDPRQLALTDPKAALEMALTAYEQARKEVAETRMLAEMHMGPGGLEAENSAQLWWLAGIYYRSGAAPVDDMTVKVQGQTRPRPERDVRARLFLKMTFGAELGLKPLQAIQNVAVINNRPCIWGDAAKAIVLQSGLSEYVYEEEVGKQGTDSWGFKCVTKRKGNALEEVTIFTVADAKRAGLMDKNGSLYKLYPQRMLMFRARGFRLRDSYPDVMKGLITAEEATDLVHERQAPSLDVAFREMVGTTDQSEPPQIESPEAEQPPQPADAQPDQPEPAEAKQETDAAVQSTPPAEAESGVESDILDEYLDQIEQADTIAEATKWRDQADADQNLSPQSTAIVHTRYGMRASIIRGHRGSRTNSRKLFEASEAATERD